MGKKVLLLVGRMVFYLPMTKIKSSCKVLLFDIGGVLVKLVGIPRMMEFTHYRFSVPELWERWILSPVIRSFESGNMTVEEFGHKIVDEFAISIDPEHFLREFIAWPVGTFPGVEELLTSIKRHAIIASLSNTNVLHWERMIHQMNFVHLFDYNFPSHITTLLKPDVATYLHVAKEMGVDPGEVLFFDDNRINTDGARAAGMDAVVVDGIDALKREVEKRGYLE